MLSITRPRLVDWVVEITDGHEVASLIVDSCIAATREESIDIAAKQCRIATDDNWEPTGSVLPTR